MLIKPLSFLARELKEFWKSSHKFRKNSIRSTAVRHLCRPSAVRRAHQSGWRTETSWLHYLSYASSSLHGILESTDRLAKKIRRFLKNNLPIFKLVFADFRMTQNYVYTKFKDWVLKKSRNQEFHFSLGISRLFCDYFIPRYARDEIITKQSRNPLGKVKFSDFYFSSLINPQIWYINSYSVISKIKKLRETNLIYVVIYIWKCALKEFNNMNHTTVFIE